MTTTRSPISLLRMFRRDQRGTAITEFTITLPLFILTFLGITTIGKYWRTGIDTSIRANKSMWGNAIPVQKNLVDWHQSPTISAFQGGAQTVGNISPYPVADIALGGSYIGLGIDGTKGEAAVPTLIGGISGLGFGVLFATEPFLNDYAKDVFEDAFPNPPPFTGASALILWNAVLAVPPTPFLVPRHAIAAGSRYGQEQGQASQNYTVPWGGTYTTSADYRVMVAPRPVDTDFIPVGYNRLGAEEYECFREVLGINWSQPYIGCPGMGPGYYGSPPSTGALISGMILP